jgi:hypothetical protein
MMLMMMIMMIVINIICACLKKDDCIRCGCNKDHNQNNREDVYGDKRYVDIRVVP